MPSLQLKAATSTIVRDEPVEAVQATLGMFVALAVGGGLIQELLEIRSNHPVF